MSQNFAKISLGQNFKPQPTSAISSPANGDVYYDSTRNTLTQYINGNWTDIQSRTDVASAATMSASGSFPASVVQSSLIRITGSTAGNVTGLTAASDAKYLILYNESSALITLVNQSGSEATAANRIICPNSSNLTLTAGQSTLLAYDSSQARWIVITSTGTGNSSGVTNYISNGTAETGATTGWATYSNAQTATFTNGSANIGLPSVTGLYIGMPVNFTTTGTLPTNFSPNTTYYITSIVSLNIQVSATKGGTAISAGSAGSGTQTFRPLVPVNGTGGSPSSTWTATSTNPLHGSYSFLYTKSANNLSGEGVSYAFTIDPGDQTKVMQIAFDYEVASGTFVAGATGVDSDLEVGIYDVTNGVLIQPTTYKLFSNSSTVTNSFIGNFQTASNSTSYLLIVYVATASTSAYTVEFDNIQVSPTQYSYNTVITDWQNFPNTSIGAAGSTNTLLTVNTGTAPTYGTMSNQIARWRRVGGDMEIDVILDKLSGGTTQSSSSIMLMNLPPGYSIDTTKTGSNSSADNFEAGVGVFHYTSKNGGTRYSANGMAHAWNSTQLYFDYGIVNSGAGLTSSFWSAADDFFTSAQSPTGVHIHATLPISGWSVQQQTSDLNDQRVTSMTVVGSPTGTISSTPSITIFNTTPLFDTHAAYSSSTGRYTVPTSGLYRVSGSINITTSSGANNATIGVYKNGVVVISATPSYNGTTDDATISGTIQCSAGDLIDLRISTPASTPSYNTSTTTSNFFSLDKLGNPAQISSTETVAAMYWMSANFTSSSTTPFNFDSKEYDSHGAVTTGATTWHFTAPIAGLYEVTTVLLESSGTAATQLYKNGTVYKTIATMGGTGSTSGIGTVLVRLNAGDTIDVRNSASSTATGGTLAGTTTSNISIVKVGI